MNRLAIWASVALLLLCPATSVRSQAVRADPAEWGVYSQLVGTSGQAGADGYRIRWTWARPGAEMLQEWIHPKTGKVAHHALITRGPEKGQLRQQTSMLGNKVWNGTVQPDGSVLFIGEGLIKAPNVVSIEASGDFLMRPVMLDGNRIAAYSDPKAHQRFTRQPQAPMLASAAPAATAAGAPASAVASVASARPAAVTAPPASPVERPFAAVEPDPAYGSIPENAAQAEIVRRFVAGMHAGKAPLERVIPQARDATAGAVAEYRERLAPFGAVTRVDSWGVNTLGHHLFRVAHQHGATLWKVRLTPQGLVAGFAFKPQAQADEDDFAPRLPPWGYYAVMVGDTWSNYDGDKASGTVSHYSWDVPGQVMRADGPLGTRRMVLNARFEVVSQDDAPAEKGAQFDADGHLSFTGTDGAVTRWRVVSPDLVTAETRSAADSKWYPWYSIKRTPGARVTPPAEFRARLAREAAEAEAAQAARMRQYERHMAEQEQLRNSDAGASPLQGMYDALVQANAQASRQEEASRRSLERTMRSMAIEAGRQQRPASPRRDHSSAGDYGSGSHPAASTRSPTGAGGGSITVTSPPMSPRPADPAPKAQSQSQSQSQRFIVCEVISSRGEGQGRNAPGPALLISAIARIPMTGSTSGYQASYRARISQQFRRSGPVLCETALSQADIQKAVQNFKNGYPNHEHIMTNIDPTL